MFEQLGIHPDGRHIVKIDGKVYFVDMSSISIYARDYTPNIHSLKTKKRIKSRYKSIYEYR